MVSKIFKQRAKNQVKVKGLKDIDNNNILFQTDVLSCS